MHSIFAFGNPYVLPNGKTRKLVWRIIDDTVSQRPTYRIFAKQKYIENCKSSSISNFAVRQNISTDIHYDPCIVKPENNLAQHIVDKINREFCDFSEDLLSRKEFLALAELPYKRVIVGSEAIALQEKFRSVWGYVNTSYWFPLMGDEPKEISNKFFVMFDYVEPYMQQLEQIIGLPKTHIYLYGEGAFKPQSCFETAELFCGCETIYTDKDFSWAIYFSHENTVAFAGSIVFAVKKLLSKEKEHWDKFECNFE